MTSPAGGQLQQAVLDLQPVGITGSAEEAARTAVAAIDAIRNWAADRHNWVRIAWFTTGYAMIIIGVGLIAKPAVDKAAGGIGKITKAVV